MLCPKCGANDPETMTGVSMKSTGSMNGAQFMEMLATGIRPEPEPLEPPIAWCSECDYTADTREDFDTDCTKSPHYKK